MPHLVLEYSANLADRAPDRSLFLDLHRLLESVAGIRIENCKSRWRRVDDWTVGEGDPGSAFVHLDIRFLEGRSPQVQRAVGTATLGLLRERFSAARNGLDLQITVEIREIRKTAYFKDPPAPLAPPPLKQV